MIRSILRTIPWLVVATSGPTGFAQMVPDARIDTASAPGTVQSFDVRIAADGSSFFVVWVDVPTVGGDVQMNRSLDGGSTWLAADVRVDHGPSGTAATFPDVAASAGVAYVVWEDDRNGALDVYFNRSLDGGVTWSPSDVRIDTDPPGAATSSSPRLAVSGTAVYVAWSDWRNGSSDVYFSRSLDAGATWLASDVRLDTGAEPGSTSSGAPEIATSGSAVHVAYHDSRNGPTDVYYNRSLDSGSTWLGTDVRLDVGDPAGASQSYRVDLAVVGSGVYVVWEDERLGNVLFPRTNVYLNRFLDDGTSFLGSDVRVDHAPDVTPIATLYPKAEVTGGAVVVAWTDTRYGQNDVFANRSLDDGVTWLATDLRIDSGDPPGANGSIEVRLASSGSRFFATWMDYRNSGAGIPDVYFNRSLDAGATWLAADRRLVTGVPPGTAFASDPEIAASGDVVGAVWRDSRNFLLDVYFNLPFGLVGYGAGKAGSGAFTPALEGAGAPVVGSAIAIDVSNGLGGAAGAVFLGLGGRLALATLGGTLLVAPPIFPVPFALGGTAGVPGAGTGSLPLSIPPNPALVGQRLNFQAMFLDPGSAGSPVSMTGGVECWIG
jgi:hypothetical protein